MSFLENRWYAAAWSEELGTKPLGRKILNEDVTLFRTQSGKVVAMASACPHRAAPLYFGEVVGENIKCRYHGLQFASDGACAYNPDGSKPPPLRAKTYKLVEKNEMIWIWMGNVEPVGVPSDSLALLSEAGLSKRIQGYLHIKCNYQLISDNLTDYAHASHLHPDFATDGAIAVPRGKHYQEGDCIYAQYLSADSPPGAFLGAMAGLNGHVDQWATVRWEPAAFINIETSVTGVGRPATEGIMVRISNLITPETNTTSHYFWGASRSFRQDDQQISELMRMNIQRIFETEDAWMLEGQQKMLDAGGATPALLAQDRQTGTTRQYLKKLVASQTPVQPSQPAVDR